MSSQYQPAGPCRQTPPPRIERRRLAALITFAEFALRDVTKAMLVIQAIAAYSAAIDNYRAAARSDLTDALRLRYQAQARAMVRQHQNTLSDLVRRQRGHLVTRSNTDSTASLLTPPPAVPAQPAALPQAVQTVARAASKLQPVRIQPISATAPKNIPMNADEKQMMDDIANRFMTATLSFAL